MFCDLTSDLLIRGSLEHAGKCTAITSNKLYLSTVKPLTDLKRLNIQLSVTQVNDLLI